MKKRLLILCGVVALICGGAFSYHLSALKDKVSIQESTIGEGVYQVINEEDSSIFDLDYQNQVEEAMASYIEEASIDQPFYIYNPYGTNLQAINFYFHDDIESLSYVVHVDGYEDYSQSLQIGEDGYQIIGLIAGEINTLTLYVNDQEMTYTFDMPATQSDIATQIDYSDGESEDILSSGLYAMMGKETRSNIFLYDNNGVLRGELVVDNDSYRADRILTIDDCLMYSYSKTGFVMVNKAGQIEDIYSLDDYYMHHDYVYDQDNHKLLILANENDADTIEDIIISLDLYTGEVEELVDFKDLLPDMYASAYDEDGKNTYGGDELDWLHLNSLSIMEDGSLLVSSRELSTIIKLNDIYGDASIDYMIGDESIYEGYDDCLSLLLEKEGDFTSQAGQHTVIYSQDESLQDGQYYVTIFNNNFGRMATRTDYDWSQIEGVGTYQEGEASYFYQYLVDENEGTYSLVESIDLPYSAIVSSVEYYQGHVQTSSGRDGSFGEYDSDGQLIREYHYDVESHSYRVMKYDFHLWFQ